MSAPVQPLREQDVPPPHSIEDVELGEESSLQGDILGTDELTPEIRMGLEAMYGSDFPLLELEPDEESWARWSRNLWDEHAPAAQRRQQLIERNRLFRQGFQWISSTGGQWREPAKPKDTARVVDNLISPALDQRIEIVSEQRPGFNTRPASGDQDARKKAEAHQFALEYQYDSQSLKEIIRELAYWAGTDGVSFYEVFWDPEAGPWHDFMTGERAPLGDVRGRVRRIEQVRVSAEATVTKEPWYVVIREVMSLKEAVRTYGLEIASEVDDEKEMDTVGSGYPFTRATANLYPDIDEEFREMDTVDRLTVYIRPSEFLPEGLHLVVVGGTIVLQSELLWGVIPVIPFRDGSTDPAYFPTPVMDKWIEPQMRVNAVLSKWVENVRLNANPRLLSKKGGIVQETFVGGASMSVIEVQGLGALNEIVRPMEAFSLGKDAIELLNREKKAFEDISGWNDVSRGQFQSGSSGRAILAIREQLERIFAPSVNAAAMFAKNWGKVSIAGMVWGYDVPRVLSVEGKARPDLAMAFVGEDFDGVVDLWIDPETLMPMPRALRLFLLNDYFQKGLMDAQEFRRRAPFAWTRNIASPDEDQEARARRVAFSIRQGQPLPILWQDNEAIHQDIIERELILPDDIDPQIRQLAIQHWFMLAQQSQMKQGLIPAVLPPGPQPQQGGQGPSLPAETQPLQGTSPSISAGPRAGDLTDQDRAASQFESTQQGGP